LASWEGEGLPIGAVPTVRTASKTTGHAQLPYAVLHGAPPMRRTREATSKKKQKKQTRWRTVCAISNLVVNWHSRQQVRPFEERVFQHCPTCTRTSRTSVDEPRAGASLEPLCTCNSITRDGVASAAHGARCEAAPRHATLRLWWSQRGAIRTLRALFLGECTLLPSLGPRTLPLTRRRCGRGCQTGGVGVHAPPRSTPMATPRLDF